jgi:transketolase
MRGDLPPTSRRDSDYKKELAADSRRWPPARPPRMALEVINPVRPETLGGSADLTGSNNTDQPDRRRFTPDDFSGRYIHYGIREHGMAAAMNGIALHGGLIPYGGTFLVFTDYARRPCACQR